MAETALLLPQMSKPHEHPIFLRVCHSPWKFMNQQYLLLFRFLIAAYFTTVLGVTMDYEVNKTTRGALFPFFAGHVSFVMQFIYYWITVAWTFQHLAFPRRRHPESEPDRSRFISILFRLVSIPRTTSPGARHAFSVFYTATTTFPFVITFIFWFALDGTRGHGFQDGPMEGWITFSIFAANSIIAGLEILVLSSVRKQKRILAHATDLVAICGLYFCWAEVGRWMTGEYVYKQLDPNYNGWKGVVLSMVVPTALTMAMFLVNFVLHDARDYCTAKAACDRRDPSDVSWISRTTSALSRMGRRNEA